MTSNVRQTDCLRLALALRLAAYHAGAEAANAATPIERIPIAPDLVTEAAGMLEAIGGRIVDAPAPPLDVQDQLLEALASATSTIDTCKRRA